MENNKEMLNYLLICLGEECAEVQKAIAKYQRFGKEKCYEADTNNIEDIMLELNDVNAVAYLITSQFPEFYAAQSTMNLSFMDKITKVKKYAQEYLERKKHE